jgi:uncharacterized protein with FMN-binding domain
VKKYVIGIAVALVFVVYTFVLRHQHSKPIIPPSSLSHSSTGSSTASGSSTSSTSSTQTPTTPTTYKDGTYTGSITNAYYGNVQVSATIQSSKISAVNFLQYPHDNPNSVYVNTTAIPYLKQEAIQAQSSNVNIITGATLTSNAFIQSLANALSQAK